MTTEEMVRRKYAALADSLTERSRRLWAGTEADALGHGGLRMVARATGLAISTVQKGRNEVRAGVRPADLVRERRQGAGRIPLEKQHPRIMEMLEQLVSPSERGDPESPLRWTIKSLRTLSKELVANGLKVSASKVAELLHGNGFSLQGNSRVKEGIQHPDRNAQFEHIKTRSEEFLRCQLPVISVDTKKKEAIGDFARAGREWREKGNPLKVQTYDFLKKDDCKVVPYGVYDVGANKGFVNVGTDHDTPKFAVCSIEKWWESFGQKRYPSARQLFITADSGGSNSAVSRVWKARLQEFADRSGLTIEVSHFPPGTSKWNKIEHRLFSFITLNWRGRPLVSYETVIALIEATQTTKGLRVAATLDLDRYPLGLKISKHHFGLLSLKPADFRGNWNYCLAPRTKAAIHQASLPAPRRSSTRAQWEAVVAEQISSGLNCTRFCKQRGINYEAFISARRQLKGPMDANVSRGRKRGLAKIAYERLLAD